MSDTIAIAVRILDELERQRIVSMFEVMSPRLNNHWVVTSLHDAAVVVLDTDDAGSDYFLEACKDSAGAVPVLLGHTNTLQADWFLQRPLRVKSLVLLLNHLGQYLRGRKTRLQTRRTEIAIEATSEFGKLRQLFDQMMAQPAYYRLDISPTWPLYFDSVRDRILLPHELSELGNPFNAIHHVVRSFHQRKMTAITAERFKSISNDKRFALFNRDALIWTWCLGHSNPDADSKVSDQLYQLNHWPNLTALPHTASHLKLCQYMTTHRADQQTIAAETDTPLQTVISFCNACESLGLLLIRPAVSDTTPIIRKANR